MGAALDAAEEAEGGFGRGDALNSRFAMEVCAHAVYVESVPAVLRVPESSRCMRMVREVCVSESNAAPNFEGMYEVWLGYFL